MAAPDPLAAFESAAGSSAASIASLIVSVAIVCYLLWSLWTLLGQLVLLGDSERGGVMEVAAVLIRLVVIVGVAIFLFSP